MYHLGIFIEFITVVIAFLNYSKFKNTIYRYFIFYLAYVAINEIIGVYVFVHTLKISNTILYNIYYLISFLFYFYFYKNLIRNKKSKQILNVLTVLFFISFFYEVIKLKGDIITYDLNISYVIRNVLLMIVLILFLLEIINNEKIIFNISKSIIFWISIGLLLFFVGTIPIFITKEILNYNMMYQYILFGLNIIMYGCFIIGFIVSKKEFNYLSNDK